MIATLAAKESVSRAVDLEKKSVPSIPLVVQHPPLVKNEVVVSLGARSQKQGMNESLFNQGTIYSEGNTMEFTEDYIKQVIKEEYEALLDEKKKKPCKPAKGKRFAKRVNGKCRSYGQAGQAKGGGDRIRPGTKKGDAYCARSAKIKKCKNPPCANDLSRKKWKCRGSKSMK